MNTHSYNEYETGGWIENKFYQNSFLTGNSNCHIFIKLQYKFNTILVSIQKQIYPALTMCRCKF